MASRTKAQIQADFKWTPESQRAFLSGLNEAVKLTGRSMPVWIRTTAIWCTRHLIKTTPIAPGTVRTHFRKRKDSGEWVWNDIPYEFKPRGRGYARAGWVRPIQKLHGKMPGNTGATTWGDALQHGDLRADLRTHAARPFAEMSNMIPYIETLDAHGAKFGTPKDANFLNQAMNRTARQLENKLKFYRSDLYDAWLHKAVK